MPSPVADVFASLRAAFERLGVRWYVFGAQAVIAWGAPRLTADTDVTVDLGEHPTSELVREMSSEGLRTRVDDVQAFMERTHVLPLVHEPSGMPVDVVLAGSGPEERFLDRAQPVRFGDVEVPVMAPEDVVAVKILAGRPQDRQDAEGLLRTRTLDLELIHATLEFFEKALDRSDLRAELDAILTRIGK